MPWDSTGLWVAELAHAPDGRPTIAGAAPVAGGEERVDLPARVGSRRPAVVHLRSHRLVEPLPLRRTGPPDRAVDRGGRAARARSASRRGCSASPATRSSPTAGSCSRTPPTDATTSPSPIPPVVGSIGCRSARRRSRPSCASRTTMIFIGASFTSEPAVEAALVGRNGAAGGLQIAAPAPRAGRSAPPTCRRARPIVVSRPAAGRPVAHALFYSPANPEHAPPQGERPPLVVMIHGGPTSMAQPELRLVVQFWTSRGFAVVDVNYRGSTGYGRRYRNELRGPVGDRRRRRLPGRGPVPGRGPPRRRRSDGDPRRERRWVHRAGRADVHRHVRGRGQHHYGVADLTRAGVGHPQVRVAIPRRAGRPLARRTPSGTGSGRRSTTSISSTGRSSCCRASTTTSCRPTRRRPIVDALARRGVPHSYLTFEGEGHGFRKAANIRRALEAELQLLHPGARHRASRRRGPRRGGARMTGPGSREHRFATLDVFTERPFAGNPLAVVEDADDCPTTRCSPWPASSGSARRCSCRRRRRGSARSGPDLHPGWRAALRRASHHRDRRVAGDHGPGGSRRRRRAGRVAGAGRPGGDRHPLERRRSRRGDADGSRRAHRLSRRSGHRQPRRACCPSTPPTSSRRRAG